MVRRLPSSLYRKGAAGYGRDDESENFCAARDELWRASSSGNDPRWSDNKGYERGALGFTDDDPAFRSPSHQGENTTARMVDDPISTNIRWGEGEGRGEEFRQEFGGMGPVRGGGSGPPRYSPKNIGVGSQHNVGGTDRKGRR